MHDIDRTQREGEFEAGYQYEGFGNEYEGEFEQEMHSLSHEHEHEGEFEFEGEFEGEGEMLHEHLEMELATELLEVQNEAELEQFLGNLFKKAVGAVKSFARSSTGKALGGMLKGVAKKALPIVGKAVGTYFGGPAGAAIGGKLGSMAGNLFELELEGLSHEDRELEVARRFVRLGTAAAKSAAYRPQGNDPRTVARTAILTAARKYAPGLVYTRRCSCGKQIGPAAVARPSMAQPIVSGTRTTYSTAGGISPVAAGTGRTGRWYRKGRSVVLMGM